MIRVALRENLSASRDTFIADENTRPGHYPDGAVRFRTKRTADPLVSRRTHCMGKVPLLVLASLNAQRSYPRKRATKREGREKVPLKLRGGLPPA
jgi:hypothetical protein